MNRPRVHAPTSTRATVNRFVQKNLLSGPYYPPWPALPANLQNVILAQVLDILAQSHIHDYRRAKKCFCSKESLKSVEKRKAPSLTAPARKKACLVKQSVGNQALSYPPNPSLSDHETSPEPRQFRSAILNRAHYCPPLALQPRPALLDHLTIGVNAVTKQLEAQILPKSLVLSSQNQLTRREPTAIVLVLACLADIEPPTIVEHIPRLIAAHNSSIPPDDVAAVRLVTLPKGSEPLLAQLLGLRRVCVLAFDTEAPGLETLQPHMENLPEAQEHYWIPSPEARPYCNYKPMNGTHSTKHSKTRIVQINDTPSETPNFPVPTTS